MRDIIDELIYDFGNLFKALKRYFGGKPWIEWGSNQRCIMQSEEMAVLCIRMATVNHILHPGI